MSLEENKALARRFYAAFNERDMESLDILLAPAFADRTAPPDQAAGTAGLKQSWAWFYTAFPDVQIQVEAMVAEDDRVMSYLTFGGTQPHREHSALRGHMMELLRIADGRIAEL